MEITIAAKDSFVQFAETKGQSAISVVHLAGLMLTPAAHTQIVLEMNAMQDRKETPDQINSDIVQALVRSFVQMISDENQAAPLNESHFKRLEDFGRAVLRVYPQIVEDVWAMRQFSAKGFTVYVASQFLTTDEDDMDVFSKGFDETMAQGLVDLEGYMNANATLSPGTRVALLMRTLPYSPSEPDSPTYHFTYEARLAEILGVATQRQLDAIREWRLAMGARAA